MNDYSAAATLAAMVAQLGAQVLLAMDDQDDRQALALLEHRTEQQLVLGIMDREDGMAAVVIELDGVRKLAEALTAWLDEQP